MEIRETKTIIEEIVGRPLPEIETILSALWKEAYEEGYERGYEEARTQVAEWNRPLSY